MPMLNPIVQQEINGLTPKTIAEIIKDYRQGTGLTMWDLVRKYRVTFATICHIIKRRTQ